MIANSYVKKGQNYISKTRPSHQNCRVIVRIKKIDFLLYILTHKITQKLINNILMYNKWNSLQ